MICGVETWKGRHREVRALAQITQLACGGVGIPTWPPGSYTLLAPTTRSSPRKAEDAVLTILQTRTLKSREFLNHLLLVWLRVQI